MEAVAKSEPEITLPEAAHALGLSWHQTYRLVLSKRLDARRVAGRYLVTLLSVRQLIDQRARTGG